MTGKDIFAAAIEMLAENLANLTFSLFAAASKLVWILLKRGDKVTLRERILITVLAVFVGCMAGAIADKVCAKWVAHLIIAVSSIASDSIIEYLVMKVTAKEIDKKVDKLTDKWTK